MRLSIKFICLFSFLTIPFHTLCAAESPRAFVKNLENEMRQMMRTGNFARANGIFVDKFDITVFSKRCLIDHWDELTPDERERFAGLFEENLRKRMNEKMLLTKDDVDFKLTPVKIGSEDGLTRIDNRLKVRRGTFDMGILITRDGNKLRTEKRVYSTGLRENSQARSRKPRAKRTRFYPAPCLHNIIPRLAAS